MQKYDLVPFRSASLIRTLALAAIGLSAPFSSSMAAEEVIPVVQDSFVKGKESAEESMPDYVLKVAARALVGMQNVRKTFLQFHVDDAPLRDAVSARVVLTLHTDAVIVFDGDPQEQVQLVLSGAPDAEWDEKFLTWETAPNHDKLSATDDGNPNLEVLAETTLDPVSAKEDGKLTFSDPRILEFLRKHGGNATFVITSKSPPNYVGFTFFSKEGTSKPERRPVMILEKK